MNFFKKVLQKLSRIRRNPLQRVPTRDGFDYMRLGSEYGGWYFVHDESLFGSTIISAGLGEDASFDVAFAAQYRANVIIVDPTPRAVKHYCAILNSLGKPSSAPYSKGGKQPIDAYDLTNLTSKNFQIVNKALWNDSGKVKFFEPKNPQNVSHSIINFQNNYSPNSNYIEVEAITLKDLLASFNLNQSNIPIMKFDIEGAEIEVLDDMLRQNIAPKQLLIEFDELNSFSKKGEKRVNYIHKKLTDFGYQLLRTDTKTNFLYYRS